MEDRQELLKECFDLIALLQKHWGKAQPTPFGNVGTYTALHGYTKAYWSDGLPWGRSVTIEYHGENNYHTSVTTDEVMELVGKLQAIVQFFASQDWQNKVDGSVRMLKRINRALTGE